MGPPGEPGSPAGRRCDRIAAIPMAFSMLVAIATVHKGAFDTRAGGMEFPLEG